MPGMPFAKALRDQDFDPLADQIFSRMPEQLLHLMIGQGDAAVSIDDDHRVGGRLQQSPQPQVTVLFIEELLVLRQILLDGRQELHPSVAVRDRAQHEVNLDRRSDPLRKLHLPPRASVLAGGIQRLSQLTFQLRGCQTQEERFQALAHRMLRRQAVHLSCALVPREDVTGGRHREQGVRRSGEQCVANFR